jgi:hypothetical protein
VATSLSTKQISPTLGLLISVIISSSMQLCNVDIR